MKLNINAQVEVRLTPYGLEALREYYTDLGIPDAAMCDRAKGQTPVRFPLWDLMHIFGPVLVMGMWEPEIPFVGNEITVIEDRP